MGFGLSIVVKEDAGERHLIGSIDESADLQPLLEVPGVVTKINLREIRAINSLGLRKFLELMRAFGSRAVEFHECSAVFVEAVNTIPLTVGGQKHIGRIKSVVVPMTCEDQHRHGVVVAVKDIRVSGETVTLPHLSCPVCRTPQFIEGGVEPDDFLFFLIAK